jgi:hypothetical protein
MNSKQITLLATAFACITNSMSAATVEEIAQDIKNRKITINDTVLYDGTNYRLSQFEVVTNGMYEYIDFTLKKPSRTAGFIGLIDGEFVVKVSLKGSIKPLYPSEEIKNEAASNDTVYSIDISNYWDYSTRTRYFQNSVREDLVVICFSALIGTYLYNTFLHKKLSSDTFLHETLSFDFK